MGRKGEKEAGDLERLGERAGEEKAGRRGELGRSGRKGGKTGWAEVGEVELAAAGRWAAGRKEKRQRPAAARAERKRKREGNWAGPKERREGKKRVWVSFFKLCKLHSNIKPCI
jgi:hypothetical protein